jgi:tripartite-type tricarboxylate transporter receptor subunit TctC
MRVSLFRTIANGIGLAIAAVTTAVHAQSPAEFFKRAGITMYVGSGSGGGFDAYARIFAPHFSRHVPGNPNIVIKNMPGATGLVAINFLANSAPRDGSALLASFNTVILNHLYGDANAKFDPRQLSWLGSLGRATGTCLTWRTSPVTNLEQALARESLMGATGEGSTPVMYPRLLNAMLGTKFKIITGYSTPGLRLAVESGEVEGVCGVTWETHMASAPHWILDHKVNFILQLGLKESVHLKGVPLALDYIKNPQDRQVFALLGTPLEFSRPIIGPPGVPAERLQALRQAFEDTIRDPAYLADAEKAKTYVDPMTAQECLDLIAQDYAAPKEVIERAATYATSN